VSLHDEERHDVTLTYGFPEEIPGEVRQYVDVPGVFFVAPPQRLEVTTVPLMGRKRFTTWRNERDEKMGEWRWVRQGTREYEEAVAA
jgi:hypothetical protein